jgi:hypothetical protein
MRVQVAYLALHRRTNAQLAPLGRTADPLDRLTAFAGVDGVTHKGLVARSLTEEGRKTAAWTNGSGRC